MDRLVYGTDERARAQITDEDLLRLFAKTYQLDPTQKATVSEVHDAFLFRAGVAKRLTVE